MKDYWTFSAIQESFQQTGYGTIVEINGLTWRQRGGDYVLLTPPGDVELSVPEGANLKRIRSLTWSAETIGIQPIKSASKCWYTPGDWNPEEKAENRRVLSKGNREGLKLKRVTEVELQQLLLDWAEDKSEHDPQVMVVKGHYKAMINHPGFEFLGFYSVEGLEGSIGYTRDGESSAIGFAKHHYGPWWLPRYMWLRVLQILLPGSPKGVNCGDTADGLKAALGFSSMKQFRVDFSKL